MHMLYDLKDMLCDELEMITQRGDISTGSLDIIDKLTHSIKSIDTILAMEEAGYSYEDGGNSGNYSRGYSNRGYSNARGRGSNAKRDSMGRYSSRYGGGASYESSGRMSRESSGRGRRGYSYDDAKNELMEHLRDLDMNTQDEATKQMIQKFMRQAEED